MQSESRRHDESAIAFMGPLANGAAAAAGAAGADEAGELVEGGAIEALEAAGSRALSSAATSFVLRGPCRLSDQEIAEIAALGGLGLADAETGRWPQRVVSGDTPLREQKQAWSQLTKWRIRRSFNQRSHELCWLFDKVAQPGAVKELVGLGLHVPTIAWALLDASFAGDCAGIGAGGEAARLVGEEAFEAALRQQVQRNEGCVLKPINGAGGQHVAVWTASQLAACAGDKPMEAPHGGAAGATQNCRQAARLLADARDIAKRRADLSEPWQILQSPLGVILQPLYSSGCTLSDDDVPGNSAPLELKLHVFFGVVLGGTLHTHPWNYWIDHCGCVHVLERAARKVRCSQLC